MKNFKKIMAILLLSMLAVLTLTACGGEKTPPAQPAPAPKADIRLAALKGPTSMGLVKLLADNEAGTAANNYQFKMAGTADEIVAGIGKGELDIAAVPCNLASVLYNNMQGKVVVCAVNTLGVLYIVENGDTVQSIADLKGKTIYSTGKGTTPEFALNYILQQNGINPETDVTIEFKSEATEVAALMMTEQQAIAVLPEPFVTTAQTKNAQLRTALSLTEEWDKVQDDSALITGVIIASRDFLTKNPAALDSFLAEYQASTEYVNANVAEAAGLVEKYGIAPAAVAKTAIPKCNITYLAGEEMQEKISGYLSVLLAQNPKSVGGKLPDEQFYYIQK